MTRARLLRDIAGAVIVLCYLQTAVQAFSWHPSTKRQDVRSLGESQHVVGIPISGLSSKYAVALSELQELESEPLCHRLAARHLVTNCQLLDGHDDATVLTDTGRAARDFVDSYAASLAICDLERGNFIIPQSCSKFREPALAALSPSKAPQLHVSTAEIDSCLEGLAQTDSTWNTWVSYRHKALRFCEAARADSEKDQQIHLYERLTKILAKLTSDMDKELDDRLSRLELKLNRASIELSSLAPTVDRMRDGLEDVHHLVQNVVRRSLHDSAGLVETGVQEATILQHLLHSIFEQVSDHKAALFSENEAALQAASTQVQSEVQTIMGALSTMAVFSADLQRDLENSQLRAADVAKRQDVLGQDLEKLERTAESVSQQQEAQLDHLKQVKAASEEVMSTLEGASSAASGVRNSLITHFSESSWWPHILCPAASLVMGSYGLSPSVLRNIFLLGLGEAFGFALPAFQHFIAGQQQSRTATYPIAGHNNESSLPTGARGYVNTQEILSTRADGLTSTF